MRKIVFFRLFVTLLLFWAMVTALAAQNTNVTKADIESPPVESDVILYEDFEHIINHSAIPADWTLIDADGDGNNWGGWPGEVLPGHNSEHCANSSSYVGDIGPVTPDNYLITPKIEGAKRVKYWVSAQDAGYSAEHYAVMASTTGTAVEDFVMLFEETMTAKGPGSWYERTIDLPEGTKYIAWRHYNCTDMFCLKLDDVTVYGFSTSALEPVTNFTVANLENNLGRLTWNYPNGYRPDSKDRNVQQLCGYNIYANGTLLAKIEDATTLEYIDSTYFQRTVPWEVEYCIKAVYNNNIESTAVCDTLNYLTSDVILHEDFENMPTGSVGSFIPTNWSVIDADGDYCGWGNWGNDIFEGHNSKRCVYSGSYVGGIGPVTPDNYLITPKVEGAKRVNYWVSAQDANWSAEHYAVMASTTGTAAEDFVMLFEETMTGKASGAWYERTIDLPEGTKYIAWRHYNCTDMYYLKLDDVTVYGSAAEPQPVTDFTATIVEHNLGHLKWNYPNGYQPNGKDQGAMQLTGYNIYANGALLAKIEDATVLEYVDSTYLSRGESLQVEYCVKAVYNESVESAPVCATLQYTITSTEAVQSDIGLRIFPNPASNVLHVEGMTGSGSVIDLYDARGIRVLSREVKAADTTIDTSQLSSGFYLLKVVSGNRTYTEKIEITRD